MSDARLRPQERLRKSREFQRVFDRRCRASDEYLLLYAAENAVGYARLGISVSRRWGNAVSRNRIKRRFREAFRLNKAALPCGLDLVMIPRTSAAVNLQQWSQSLVRLARRVWTKLRESAAAETDP